jgi:hypothetical protein
MSAFFKARATNERVPLINARMNGRCLHASGSYNIFCTKIKLNFFVLNCHRNGRDLVFIFVYILGWAYMRTGVVSL